MKHKVYSDLKNEINKQNIKCDLEKLDRAWEFAQIAHSGQKRLTGESYVFHPLTVSIILATWRMDEASIIAGLLHDTVEDCGVSLGELEKEFGDEVTILVDGVTNVSHIRLKGSTEGEFVENLRKMFLVMAKDLRVVIIKFADRLHNMRTLDPLPPLKRVKIASETLEVFAPLAERLGMGQVRAELDDLAFAYVYPKKYERVLGESRKHFLMAEEHLRLMREKVKRELKNEKVECEIQTREKHLYSLWKKLERVEIGWDFEKVHDIVAMRIIVREVSECYVALGVVHKIFKPVPHLGISDFIAQPKPNGYRSIHTKVFGPEGRIVEAQIRTVQMNEQAEYGVAAHWAYSDAKAKGMNNELLEAGAVKVSGNKLSWVKQLVDWQKEIKDSEEYMRSVKFDALNHRNFVFSPKGDVYDLPSGATPVDFAFAVHTDLGSYVKGAKVNGRVVPLSYKLSSGDVVEIIKSKNSSKPSSGWLDFVTTTAAKRRIKRMVE